MMLKPADRPPFPAAAGVSRARFGVPKLVGIAALVLVAVFYLVFVREHTSYLASNSDASGYFNVARLLRSGKFVQKVPRIAGLTPPAWDYFYQQPLGFAVDSERGTMVTTYPVGLPLHFLAAASIVGDSNAGIAVNVLLAAAAAGLMITLGRQLGLPWSWSLAAGALLWACPLFVLFVLQPMSDVCATVWSLAAICAALQSRGNWRWGFLAGLAVGVAVLVRPTNLLLIVPVALAVGLSVRAWLAIVAGGLPGAVFLAWYNLNLYGAVVTTGYPEVGHLFAWRFVPHNAGHFALWILLLLSPLVALPALSLPWFPPTSRAHQRVLISWCVVFTGFYVFYFHSGETWWYLRFILPMFPAVIFAALLAARQVFSRLPSTRPWRVLPIALLACTLLWEFTGSRKLNVALTKDGDRPYLWTVHWMQSHAPADAIILQMQLSGSFTYYTNYTIVRWDLIKPASWEQLRAAARASGRPLYATLFEFEESRAFSQQIPGNWERMAQIKQVSIWRLSPPSPPPPTS